MMIEDSPKNITHSPLGLLRLRTLVRLRWLAVIGQTIAVLLVQFILQFNLPLMACLAVIATSAWLNVFFSLKWRGSSLLSNQSAGLLLSYDILQLSSLIYLTGGLQNPFALLVLVPITVSATSLPKLWTITLGFLGLICISVLAFTHFPLPWAANEALHLPKLYLAGLWAAILCATVFSSIYARRIAEEARQMSSALQATELVLAREQRLSALDGLAAAAAHELGTPLATIALVAKELKRELPKNFAHAEDIDLLISQAARCREILTRLAVPEQLSDETYQKVSLSALLEDLIAPLRNTKPHIKFAVAPLQDADQEPIFPRNPAITYGLTNLLENAGDFAISCVALKADWSANAIKLQISDDGPGFDQSIFDRLGDPFVTTRRGYGASPITAEGEHEGMGLGLFIAKTLLERSGATVALSNCKFPDKGANINITWPRSAVDIGK